MEVTELNLDALELKYERLLAKTAAAYNVERFLFISTDKAVRPTSVMGAERLGEMVLRSLSGHSSCYGRAIKGQAGLIVPGGGLKGSLVGPLIGH